MHDPTASIRLTTAVVYLLAYFLLPVLGGLTSGMLIWARYRNSAIYCLATSILIGYLTSKSAASLSAHEALSIKFIVFGTILPCLVTLIVLCVIWFASRTFHAANWFRKALASDISMGFYYMHKIKKHNGASDVGHAPRDTVKLPWRRFVAFILLAGLFISGEYAEAFFDFLDRRAPKMVVITNTMDLISLILITPKCFSGEARNSLHHLFKETANKAFGSRTGEWNTKHVLAAGATLTAATFPFLWLSLQLSSGIGAKLIEMMYTLQSIARSKGENLNWLETATRSFSGWIHILNKFDAFINVMVIASTTFVISLAIGAGFRRLNRNQQEQLEDRLLWVRVC